MRSLLLSLSLMFAGSISFAHGGSHGNTPLAAHLSFERVQLHAHVSWEKAPVVGQESILKIEFRKASDHSPAAMNAMPEVVLWMPSMGHGSAQTFVQRVLSEQGEILPGVFRVTNVYFVMGGDWTVTLNLKWPDGQVDSQAFPLSLDGESEGGHHHH